MFIEFISNYSWIWIGSDYKCGEMLIKKFQIIQLC